MRAEIGRGDRQQARALAVVREAVIAKLIPEPDFVQIARVAVRIPSRIPAVTFPGHIRRDDAPLRPVDE